MQRTASSGENKQRLWINPSKSTEEYRFDQHSISKTTLLVSDDHLIANDVLAGLHIPRGRTVVEKTILQLSVFSRSSRFAT